MLCTQWDKDGAMTLQIAMAEPVPPNRVGRLAAGQARVARTFGRLPPTALMLLAMLGVQLGSALATVLFSSLGPAGTAFVSTIFSAAVLTLFARPKLDRPWRAHALLIILLFGLADAVMALPFFLALQSIPLGIASAITFLGPLGVAVVTSHRPLHFLWISLGALGIGLLTPAVGGNLDPLGLGLAALAAVGWAAFVPLTKLAGRAFGGIDGLTLGLWVATALLLPFALAEGTMLRAGAFDLGGAFVVALLSVV